MIYFCLETREATEALTSVSPQRCEALHALGGPGLTAAVAELHCHVAFGSDGHGGCGPDRVQPFPGSPGANLTSSIKT